MVEELAKHRLRRKERGFTYVEVANGSVKNEKPHCCDEFLYDPEVNVCTLYDVEKRKKKKISWEERL